MGNEAAALAPSPAGSASARAVGSDELAHGLLLMRASAIKVVRLQLAMERRDRRAAIETVDDLMSLDRRISDFLDDLPVSTGSISEARDEVEAQGRALAREKLTLAAGLAGPLLAPRPSWAEPAAPEPATAEPPLVEAELILEQEVTQLLEDFPPAERGSTSHLTAALLVLALIAIAGIAFLYLSGAGADLLAGTAFEGAW